MVENMFDYVRIKIEIICLVIKLVVIKLVKTKQDLYTTTENQFS